MYAWQGMRLTVDLSAGTVRRDPFDENTLHRFLGGRGLGVALLGDHVRLDPFDPAMPLILSVGPLCGTPAPTSARMSVVSRSPLTGTVFDSSVGGSFALRLKGAGIDSLIVTGKAAKPVYLEIREDRVAIHEAGTLWGKGCGETARALADGGVVACIGPAGERLVRFANIMIGGNNAVGRGGMGAVMGAKNLKAVVVTGSKKTTLADAGRFKAAQDDVLRLLRASPAVMGELGLGEYGTAALVDIVDQRRMAPTENFRKTYFSEARNYSGPSLRKRYGSKKEGCAGCPIQCKKTTSCGRPMPEYETLSHFGALNANADVESIVKANLLCNNLGLDTISAGATLAAYGEARGEFLSPEGLLDMLGNIAARTGDGDLLAEGSKRWCEAAGKPALSMTVKGLELPAYDPRGSYGMALAYGTSNRGACHLRAYPISQEVLRKPVATDRFSFDGKARLIKISEDTNAVVDSLAVCKFSFLGASLEEYAAALAAASGIEYSGQGLMRAGAQIIALEREYNRWNGFTDLDDALPERFFTEAGTAGEGIEVPAIDRARFDEELQRYYRIRKAEASDPPSSLR